MKKLLLPILMAASFSAPASNFTQFYVASTSKNAGYGSFLETGLGRAGTIGYPDIGAAQATNTASTSGGEKSFIFAQ